jgi:hypothetical protein
MNIHHQVMVAQYKQLSSQLQEVSEKSEQCAMGQAKLIRTINSAATVLVDGIGSQSTNQGGSAPQVDTMLPPSPPSEQNADSSGNVVQYALQDSKICNTVARIWAEYVTFVRPLNLAHPPLKKIAMAPWRMRGNQQEKAYSRRQFIWSKIEKLISGGVAETEAIKTLESQIGDASIFKLRKAEKQND